MNSPNERIENNAPKIEKPNYTQTPNAIYALMPEMGDAELRVVMAICRATFGWHKRADVLSLSQLEQRTGLSRQGVIDGTNAAVGRGIVGRSAKGNSYEYFLVVNDVDQSTELTSQASRPGMVKPVDHLSVNVVDTQKKVLKKKRNNYSAAREKVVSTSPHDVVKPLKYDENQAVGLREEAIREFAGLPSASAAPLHALAPETDSEQQFFVTINTHRALMSLPKVRLFKSQQQKDLYREAVGVFGETDLALMVSEIMAGGNTTLDGIMRSLAYRMKNKTRTNVPPAPTTAPATPAQRAVTLEELRERKKLAEQRRLQYGTGHTTNP